MTTIRDVAREANVSLSTVSLVLNNRDTVKLETRNRVLKAIEVLNYVPNQAARTLVTKRKKVIGLISTTEADGDLFYTFLSVPNTYMTDMLEAVVQETNSHDYSIMLNSVCQTEIAFTELPSIMMKGRIDGAMFITGVIASEQEQMILDSGIPTVLVGSRGKKLDYVDTDPEKGMYLGAKRLLDNGHRDIAFINGPDASQSSARKLEGVKKAMKEAGIRLRAAYYRQGSYSAVTGYMAMADMWERGIRPTALLALDCTVLGAARFLYEQGLICPKDFSMVGFEDGLLAEHAIPPLDSIRVHKGELGRQACRTLINRIKHPNMQKVCLVLEPELMVRASVRSVG
jgi:DNA-binding LacI/PurR family transcriptional regulator